jgi:hypothetical protein
MRNAVISPTVKPWRGHLANSQALVLGCNHGMRLCSNLGYLTDDTLLLLER